MPPKPNIIVISIGSSDKTIRIRESDGFIDITHFLSQYDKRYAHWTALANSDKELNNIARRNNVNKEHLVSHGGGKNHKFVHKDVAAVVARWINDCVTETLVALGISEDIEEVTNQDAANEDEEVDDHEHVELPTTPTGLMSFMTNAFQALNRRGELVADGFYSLPAFLKCLGVREVAAVMSRAVCLTFGISSFDRNDSNTMYVLSLGLESLEQRKCY